MTDVVKIPLNLPKPARHGSRKEDWELRYLKHAVFTGVHIKDMAAYIGRTQGATLVLLQHLRLVRFMGFPPVHCWTSRSGRKAGEIIRMDQESDHLRIPERKIRAFRGLLADIIREV